MFFRGKPESPHLHKFPSQFGHDADSRKLRTPFLRTSWRWPQQGRGRNGIFILSGIKRRNRREASEENLRGRTLSSIAWISPCGKPFFTLCCFSNDQKLTWPKPFRPSSSRASVGVAGSTPSSFPIRMIFSTCSALLFASVPFSR
jgi:hypothetical protein